MAKRERRTLTPQERLFVAAYLKGEGKFASAVAAGYAESGAASLATRLLQRPAVKAAIEEFYQREESDTEVEREILRRKLFDLANLNPAVIFQEDGKTPKSIHEIPERYRHAIKSIRAWKNGEKDCGSSAKISDNARCIELYFKLFPKTEKKLDLTKEAESVHAMLDDIVRHFEAEDVPDEEDEAES